MIIDNKGRFPVDKIYLVEKKSGRFEDSRSEIVGAFASESDAQKAASEGNAAASARHEWYMKNHYDGSQSSAPGWTEYKVKESEVSSPSSKRDNYRKYDS
jgi:hypothetical protein